MINLGQMRWLPPPPVAWEGPTTNDRRSTLASLTKEATRHRGMEESNGKCTIKEQYCLTEQMRHRHWISLSKNTHRSFKFFFLGQFLYISAFDTFCIPVVSKKCTRRAQYLSGGPGSRFWLVETDQSQARLGGSWGGGVEGMSRVCPDLIPGSIICNHLTLRPTREVSGLCPVENALYRKWKTTQMCTLSHQSIWQLYES